MPGLNKTHTLTILSLVLISLSSCNSGSQELQLETVQDDSHGIVKGQPDSQQEKIHFFAGETSTREIYGGVIEVDGNGNTRTMSLHVTDEKQVDKLIRAAPHLVSLDLEFSIASDLILESVGACQELEEVFLGMPESFGENGKFTNQSLEKLSQLKSLRVLHIRSYKIDDEGIKYLSNLKNLEELDLTGCQITDESIKGLSKLPKLGCVNLLGTAVTQSGIDQLDEALVRNFYREMEQRGQVND